MVEALEQDQAAADVLREWRAFLERADPAAPPMTPGGISQPAASVPPGLGQRGALQMHQRLSGSYRGVEGATRIRQEGMAFRASVDTRKAIPSWRRNVPRAGGSVDIGNP